MVINGFTITEKLTISRLVNKADSLEDLPEKYRKAIDIAENMVRKTNEDLDIYYK